MHLPGVRPSVCLSQHGPHRQTLLLWPGRQVLSVAARCTALGVHAGSATLSAYVVAELRLISRESRFVVFLHLCLSPVSAVLCIRFLPTSLVSKREPPSTMRCG